MRDPETAVAITAGFTLLLDEDLDVPDDLVHEQHDDDDAELFRLLARRGALRGARGQVTRAFGDVEPADSSTGTGTGGHKIAGLTADLLSRSTYSVTWLHFE